MDCQEYLKRISIVDVNVMPYARALSAQDQTSLREQFLKYAADYSRDRFL